MLEVLDYLDRQVKKEFDTNQRVLSFEEYLQLLAENPDLQLRGSAQYTLDMMDFFGKTPIGGAEGGEEKSQQRNTNYRFHLFDEAISSLAPKVVGQEEVQTEIYRSLKSFARQGANNKLILLHGPNGSAKSTLIHALMNGMQRYSHEKEGAVYSFSWIFPLERATKGEIGIQNYSSKKDDSSYAKLEDNRIGALIPCELRDHPLLIIPKSERHSFLTKLLGEEKAQSIWARMPYTLTDGELSHRSREIYESLLGVYRGDFKKILQHVRVERFYYSRRYRQGLVTIEPQMHVDASYNLLSINKNMSSLPAALQNVNLFTLNGDLIDGNRGIIEFSDLLKRPVDAFKYLLTACETSSVNIGPAIAFMDTVLLGSSNELQLDAFKEFPDFSSFKARIKLIRVPYLLSIHKEEEIYRLIISKGGLDKDVAPHVHWVLAYWAVLTRLKKPNSINYPPSVSSIISSLTPQQKARLYDKGEMPHSLSADDRKLLRANINKLREEYSNIPYYEGRMGASVREIRTLLFDAAHNSEFKCVSPLAVFAELEKFVKRVSEYEFLKQDVKDGYHDVNEFIAIVREEYLDVIDREVRDSLGLYDEKQWEDFIRKYILHVSHVLKKERIQNTLTGNYDEPDQSLIKEFEGIVGSPKKPEELKTFRQSVISQVGAWALDHPQQPMQYAKVFPQYWAKLEKHYYDSQKGLLRKMQNALHSQDNEQSQSTNEGAQLAQKAIGNMVDKLGYCKDCAKEVIAFLLKKRY